MTVIAFLAEPFFKKDELFISSKASVNFITKCFHSERVVCVGRLSNNEPLAASASIQDSNFEVVPSYDSIADFFKRSLREPSYFFTYIKRCNQILERYPDAQVWARNPTIGAVIFSLCALRKKRVVYNHMCANGMEAWDNEKYKGITKITAYLFSKILKLCVHNIAKNFNTLNLCTGAELEAFCIKKNHNTLQLVDSNIKNIQENIKHTDSPFKFLFIGRIQEDKGLYELLKAFSELDSSKFELKIIGSGVLMDDLLHKYKDTRTIDFIGPKPNHLLYQYIDDSHCLIVPSKNKYEGFPRVILEAWSRSVPVIVSDVGGIHSLVKHMGNGLIYDGRYTELKKMMELICDAIVYSTVQRGAFEMAAKTTEDFWINKTKIGINNFWRERK
ncbi:glycosyltransferase [Pseudoalteromonas sp. RB2-MNA-CIBAN-0110]|uniref:glycosyltransferase n=1 Tax=Pseudoalteromonas sp. RB2-MNA-CIBAN-0110 TaxID=3140439 RepID=UPI00332ABD2E